MDNNRTVLEDYKNIVDSRSILERYRDIVDNEEADAQKTVSDDQGNFGVSEEVRRIKESPLDIRNQWIMEASKYNGIDESELSVMDEPVTTALRHAYCPDCGTEIHTKDFPRTLPAASNKLLQKKVHYTCPKCGKEMWLDRMYPCFVKLNSANKEVTGYNFGNEITLWS